MNLNRITYYTDTNEITIRKFGSEWSLQVMTGNALTQHVETIDFTRLNEAKKYVEENYLESDEG